ncbi:MAG: hypothetical protein GXO83_01345 [Chlorobi bacterium]|nr:hypothetical protein [Chlorobiota bacterium]
MKKLWIIISLCFFAFKFVHGENIQEFGVLPSNTPEVNKINLQKAIDSMQSRGGILFVDPSDTPYKIAGGIILRENVSLTGASPATPRGTRHPSKPQPVGSVFEITDREQVFITVESGTRISGIQFWYPEQSVKDPSAIIPYPATIRTSQDKPTEGVTLSNLTFYGEYLTMDFAAPENHPCELITIEHCYGYPLGGTFIRIDHCYDIPRILHCHVNPAVNRRFAGGFSKEIIDHVVSQKTYAYSIDHTDNAQIMDIFTFGTYGGIELGPATYGQLTNFNFDCVTIGIHKSGDNAFNRNWQITQGAIVANTGEDVRYIHPVMIDGQGHTSITNVEAFSGHNNALTTLGQSYDFLTVKGDRKCTISLIACRMRNYIADDPVTVENKFAIIQAIACIDKNEKPYNR